MQFYPKMDRWEEINLVALNEPFQDTFLKEFISKRKLIKGRTDSPQQNLSPETSTTTPVYSRSSAEQPSQKPRQRGKRMFYLIQKEKDSTDGEDSLNT